MAGKRMTVRVVDGFGVYDGKTQQAGRSVHDVPIELAERWLAEGWVEQVPKRRAPRRRRGPTDS